MHNAWCIYLHFGSLGGFHVSKLYHTRPCILYLLLHFWLFLMVKYMVNATSMQVDMLWPLSVWAGFFITMTNYAKPPFCFFFGVLTLLNVGIYHIYHGVIIPLLKTHLPGVPSQSSPHRLAFVSGIGVPIVAPWAMRVTLLIATRSFVNSLTWYLGSWVGEVLPPWMHPGS